MKKMKQESEILNTFFQIGVKDVVLDGLSMANKWKVLHAFKTVVQDFPCICGAVASIRMVGLDEIDRKSEAETLLLKENGHYVIRINLNSTFFASPFFPIRLWHEKRTSFLLVVALKVSLFMNLDMCYIIY